VDKRERYPTWAYSGWSGGYCEKNEKVYVGDAEGIFWIRRGVVAAGHRKEYNKKETQFAKQRSRR